MSFNAMIWAGRQRLKPNKKAVLMVLADHVSKVGTISYPSIPTIAHEAMLSVRAVYPILDDLEADGLVSIEKRTTTGGRIANVYRLPNAAALLRKDDDLQNMQGSTPAPFAGRPLQDLQVDPCTVCMGTEGKKEPRVEEQTHRAVARRARDAGPDDFETRFGEWWNAYPASRRMGMGAARKAYHQALGKINPADLLLALRGYRFPDNERYIPAPVRWLNEERWADAPGAAAPREPGKLDYLDDPNRFGRGASRSAWCRREMAKAGYSVPGEPPQSDDFRGSTIDGTAEPAQ